jgi:hypothetical protein
VFGFQPVNPIASAHELLGNPYSLTFGYARTLKFCYFSKASTQPVVSAVSFPRFDGGISHFRLVADRFGLHGGNHNVRGRVRRSKEEAQPLQHRAGQLRSANCQGGERSRTEEQHIAPSPAAESRGFDFNRFDRPFAQCALKLLQECRLPGRFCFRESV